MQQSLNKTSQKQFFAPLKVTVTITSKLQVPAEETCQDDALHKSHSDTDTALGSIYILKQKFNYHAKSVKKFTDNMSQSFMCMT